VILIVGCVVAGVALLSRAPQRDRLAWLAGTGGGGDAGQGSAGGHGLGSGSVGGHGQGGGSAGANGLGGGVKGTGGTGTAGTSAVDDLAFDLDLVAVCLQAGLPVGRALEHAARAAGDRSGLGQIARAARWGLDDLRWEETTGGAAGDGVAGESPAARALASVVAVIRFSARTGVALAPLLQSHADELRRGEHRRRQIAAARLGVMLVLPLGVCVLPAFVLLGVVPVLLTLVSDLGPAFGGV
jgi:hypothetical protein